VNVDQADVALASFDASDIGSMKPTPLSEFLLGNPCSEAKFSNSNAESFEDRIHSIVTASGC
jgi:hypothetical protein